MQREGRYFREKTNSRPTLGKARAAIALQGLGICIKDFLQHNFNCITVDFQGYRTPTTDRNAAIWNLKVGIQESQSSLETDRVRLRCGCP